MIRTAHAPRRKRPRRIAKKIARRGGYMHHAPAFFVHWARYRVARDLVGAATHEVIASGRWYSVEFTDDGLTVTMQAPEGLVIRDDEDDPP